MTQKEHLLVPLFQAFINDSYKGRRLKSNGGRIKSQTVDNYRYALRYLKEFETFSNNSLRIKIIKGSNKKRIYPRKKLLEEVLLRVYEFLIQQKELLR